MHSINNSNKRIVRHRDRELELFDITFILIVQDHSRGLFSYPKTRKENSMKLKTKQNTLKTLNNLSRINHNLKSIKSKATSFKGSINETADSNAYDSHSSFAADASKDIAKKSAYCAKQFTINSAKKITILKSHPLKKEKGTEKPVYLYQGRKVGISTKQKQNFDTFNAQRNNRLLGLFSFKRKPFFTPDTIKYLTALLSGSMVVLMLFIVVFAGIFGGENGSSFLGTFIMPFDNPESVEVNSEYGWRIHPVYGTRKFHSGIDFGTPHHCNIYASAIGEVTFAGVNGGYGNCVILKHEILGYTIYTLYAHLSKIKVKRGQYVIQGEVIGVEGGALSDNNPGTSTGHHLHFEVRDEDFKTKNPRDYLIIK